MSTTYIGLFPFETCKFITKIYCIQLISNMSRSNFIILLIIVSNILTVYMQQYFQNQQRLQNEKKFLMIQIDMGYHKTFLFCFSLVKIGSIISGFFLYDDS